MVEVQLKRHVVEGIFRLTQRRLVEQKIFPSPEFERHRHSGTDKRHHANNTAHLGDQRAQGSGVVSECAELGEHFVVSGHSGLQGVRSVDSG